MEIEIESKRNNPLLNRTEIHFTIKHVNEKTPNREIIRSELAEKLNTKKENIIVNTINSSFGVQETTGYAKIYSSLSKSKGLERRHILKRNKIGVKEDKKGKKEESASAEQPKEGEAKEQPAEQPKEEKPAEPVEETPSEPKKTEETVEEPKKEEKPVEEPAKEEDKPQETPAEQPKEGEAKEQPKEEKPAEEKKE